MTDVAGSNVITQCTCRIKNKSYDVILTNDYLKWHLAGNEIKGLQTVRIIDVLSVSLKKSEANSSDEVCVTYVKQGKELVLKSCSVTFAADETQIVSNLHQQVSALVAKNEQRPRKLLVLINPISGSGKGRSTYERKVAPIFKEAGIQTDVIVTEKAHHSEEILATYDIKSVDGIGVFVYLLIFLFFWLVLVGGDGIYHEGVNGLMRRLTKEHDLNADDPDETLPAIEITIGLIPCGTGNGIANATYGNYNVTTAALAIAVGYRSPANMMSVHSAGKLVAYSILLVGYGVWSDLIYTTESRRNQGRMRYPIAILEQMLIKTLRRLQLTLQYENKDLQTEQSNVVAELGDTENVSGADEVAEDSSKEAGRDSHNRGQRLRSTTVKESAIGSVIFMISPATALSVISQPDLSKAAMLLNKSPQRTKYISFMYRLMTLDLEVLETRDDISVLSGHQWKVKLDEQSQSGTRNYEVEHYMNIDGEVFRLPIPEYQAKLLTDKINLFSNMPYITKRPMN